MGLDILKIFLVILASGLIFFIGFTVTVFIQDVKFRKKADENDVCKVYHHECKCIGRITGRIGDKCDVKYYDDLGKEHFRSFHISQIYRAW